MEAQCAAQRVLVVGAGLTGAAFTWLTARAGHEVVLVSADRPTSQATALGPGIVHGAGPPGGILRWARLSDDDFEQAAATARRGYDVLREVLLLARRPAGFRRYIHRVLCPPTLSVESVERIAEAAERAGFPVRVERAGADLHLVRESDALVNPRRLTFELLRLAQGVGARILLGRAAQPADRQQGESVAVELSGEPAVFDRVLWATGRPRGGSRAGARLRGRIVLHQSFSAGEEPLEEILEAGDGEIWLVPSPASPGRVILVRVAEESTAGGLTWPEPPARWDLFRGATLEQRMAESFAGYLDGPRPGWGGRAALLAGFDGWPVAAILGACLGAAEDV